MVLRDEAHIGVDADSGLVHSMVGTAANVNDVTQAGALVHGEEADVFADAGYQGVAKREETQGIKANWHVAMRPGKRRALDKSTPMGAIMEMPVGHQGLPQSEITHRTPAPAGVVQSFPRNRARKMSRNKYIRLAWTTAAVILAAASVPPLVFLCGEWQRARLLDLYQASDTFLMDIRRVGPRGVSQILKPSEVLMCAIDGYGTPEALMELSAAQRRSLSKDKLPSESLTWYLIFYSSEKAERVVLMDVYGRRGLRPVESSGCLGRADSFMVSRGEDEYQPETLTIKFLKKQQMVIRTWAR